MLNSKSVLLSGASHDNVKEKLSVTGELCWLYMSMCDPLSLESKLILLKILSCVSQKARFIAELRGQLTPETVLIYAKI